MPKTSTRLRFSRLFLRHLSLYAPNLGAGIRVERLEPLAYRVEMKLRWFNRNAVGTHYGGSLYSMCDPYFMLILIERLGRDYIVWDKAATIHFRRPGRGKVTSEFSISDERVEEIRERADRGEKVEPTLEAQILDEQGMLVARVEKHLYVRRQELVAREMHHEG